MSILKINTNKLPDFIINGQKSLVDKNHNILYTLFTKENKLGFKHCQLYLVQDRNVTSRHYLFRNLRSAFLEKIRKKYIYQMLA